MLNPILSQFNPIPIYKTYLLIHFNIFPVSVSQSSKLSKGSPTRVIHTDKHIQLGVYHEIGKVKIEGTQQQRGFTKLNVIEGLRRLEMFLQLTLFTRANYKHFQSSCSFHHI